MKVEDIEEIIDKLNEKIDDKIFLKPISETVEYGVVWFTKHGLTTREKFYFIKSGVEKYIGAVLLMEQNGGDLHWFLKKEYRKKGKLTTALKEYILPHLFIEKREQRITIDIDLIGELNYSNSKKVALNVGFQPKSDYEFIIKEENVKTYDKMYMKKKGIDIESLKRLQRKILSIENELYQIQDEFEFKVGELYELDELRDFLKEIRRDTIEIKYYEYRNQDKF